MIRKSALLRPFVSFTLSNENKRYKKYISNFSHPENTIINDFITNYDLIEKYTLDGHCTKQFAMINKSQLEHYFRQAKKRNNHFETYLEDKDIISTQIPQNISILIKKENYNDIALEIYGCKVLNFFGVPTCYNFPIKDKFGNFLLGSIDFIKPNEEFYTYAQYSRGEIFSGTDSLKQINYSGVIAINEFSKRHLLFLSKSKKEELLKELIYSATIRKLVLGDSDFRSGNFGLLYNKKSHTLRNSPNFDFDYLFKSYPNHEQELRWLKAYYPELYENFKQKFNEFSKKHIYLDFLTQIKKEHLKKLIEQIESKINSIQMTINMLEKESNQPLQQ